MAFSLRRTLKDLGIEADAADLQDFIAETFHAHFPSWSVDTFLCQQDTVRDRLVRDVRHRYGKKIPFTLPMQVLVNLRKRSRIKTVKA